MKNLLNESVPAATMKGQTGGVSFIVRIVIAAVVLYALLPVVNDFISNSGLTGTNLTLANLTVTFLVLMLVLAIAGAFGV